MSGGIEYLPDISECISDGHELYIFYTNDKGNEVEGRFRPEGLKLFHNRWYLLGYRNGSEFCAVPLDALTRIYLSGNRFQTDCRFSLAKRLSDSIGVVAPTGQQPEEVTLRAYGPFADYLRKHPFHHSQVERNDMGSFTSFDYTLLVTDELVDEILALGDKVEITFPEKLRMKLLQKIGRIRNRYNVSF
jgi:predicted DNA-binding transcriptional regulator YafY